MVKRLLLLIAQVFGFSEYVVQSKTFALYLVQCEYNNFFNSKNKHSILPQISI